jgi:hypothetical protein
MQRINEARRFSNFDREGSNPAVTGGRGACPEYLS